MKKVCLLLCAAAALLALCACGKEDSTVSETSSAEWMTPERIYMEAVSDFSRDVTSAMASEDMTVKEIDQVLNGFDTFKHTEVPEKYVDTHQTLMECEASMEAYLGKLRDQQVTGKALSEDEQEDLEQVRGEARESFDKAILAMQAFDLEQAGGSSEG